MKNEIVLLTGYQDSNLIYSQIPARKKRKEKKNQKEINERN